MCSEISAYIVLLERGSCELHDGLQKGIHDKRTFIENRRHTSPMDANDNTKGHPVALSRRADDELPQLG